MATTPHPRTRGQERCIVHAFADSAAFGHASAQAALLPYQSVDVHPFPDGETLVRVYTPSGLMKMGGRKEEMTVSTRSIFVPMYEAESEGSRDRGMGRGEFL